MEEYNNDNLTNNKGFNNSFDSRKIIKEIEDNKNSISFSLLYSENISKFYKNNVIIPDNVDNLTKIFLKAFMNDIVYTNIKTGDILKYFDMSGMKYLIKKPVISWEITNEEKKIQNYNCFKAIGKHNGKSDIIVWFTPDLNISLGPLYSYGVPGFVFEYIEGKTSIVCTDIKFSLNEEQKNMLEIPKGKLVTDEEIKEIIDNMKGKYKKN